MDPPPPKKTGFFTGWFTPSSRRNTDTTENSQTQTSPSNRRQRHSPIERVELSLPMDVSAGTGTAAGTDTGNTNHHHRDVPTMNGDDARMVPESTNIGAKRSHAELAAEFHQPPRTRRRLENDSAGRSIAVAGTSHTSNTARGSHLETISTLHRYENDRRRRPDRDHSAYNRHNQESRQQSVGRPEGLYPGRTYVAKYANTPNGPLSMVYLPPSAPLDSDKPAVVADMFSRLRAVEDRSCKTALESSRPRPRHRISVLSSPVQRVPMLTEQSRLPQVAEERMLQQQSSVPQPTIARPHKRLGTTLLDVDVDESACAQLTDNLLDPEEEPDLSTMDALFAFRRNLPPLTGNPVQLRTQRVANRPIRLMSNVRSDFIPLIPAQALQDETAHYQTELTKSRTRMVFDIDEDREDNRPDFVPGGKVVVGGWGELFGSHEGERKCAACLLWFSVTHKVCPSCETPVRAEEMHAPTSTTTAGALTTSSTSPASNFQFGVLPTTTTAATTGTVTATAAPSFGQFQFGSSSGSGFQFGTSDNAATIATAISTAPTNTSMASSTSTNTAVTSSAASTQASSGSGFSFLPKSTTGANGSAATIALVPGFQFNGAASTGTSAAPSTANSLSGAPLGIFQFGTPQPAGPTGGVSTGSTSNTTGPISSVHAATDGFTTSDALAATEDIPSRPGALTPFIQSNLQGSSTFLVSTSSSSSSKPTGKRRCVDEDENQNASKAKSDTLDTRVPPSIPIQFGGAQEPASLAHSHQVPTGGATTATTGAALSLSFGARNSTPLAAFEPAPSFSEATVNGSSSSAASMFGGATSSSTLFTFGGTAPTPAPAPSHFSLTSSNPMLPPAPSAVLVPSIGAFSRTTEQQTAASPFQSVSNSSNASTSNAQVQPAQVNQFQFGGSGGATDPSSFGASNNSSSMFGTAAPSSGLFAAATPTPSQGFLGGTAQVSTIPPAPSLGFFGGTGQVSGAPPGQTQGGSTGQFGWTAAPSAGGSFGNPHMQAFGARDTYNAPPAVPNFGSNMSSSGQPAFGASVAATAPPLFGANAIPAFGVNAPPPSGFGANASGGGFGGAVEFQIGTVNRPTRKIIKAKRPGVGR